MLRWETESGAVKTNKALHHCTHVHPVIPGKACSLMRRQGRDIGVFQCSSVPVTATHALELNVYGLQRLTLRTRKSAALQKLLL
jgi:hypothetical protein